KSDYTPGLLKVREGVKRQSQWLFSTLTQFTLMDVGTRFIVPNGLWFDKSNPYIDNNPWGR
ncbi:MAG TPA: hypothetical protein PK811_06865, partial [bacterium]|nr:hypothetical protein [bacterium]